MRKAIQVDGVYISRRMRYACGKRINFLHNWKEKLKKIGFNGERPTHLELGIGKGEFLAEIALRFPETLFIGVENIPYYYLQALNRCEALGCNNVIILNCHGEMVLQEGIPDGSLDCIYLLYPDPWPKKRHHKRRMIRDDTKMLYYQKLKPEGIVQIWTDVEGWAKTCLGHFEGLPGEVYLEDVTEQTREPRTHYERKALDKRHNIYYVRYQKDIS